MLKIGDYVVYKDAPLYFGQIVGACKSNGGWWVLDRTGKSRGGKMTSANNRDDIPQMTEQVWNAIVGVAGVAWRAADEKLVLAAQPAEVSAPPAKPVTTSTQHVAGLTPESIDWEAHRAFFRGGRYGTE